MSCAWARLFKSDASLTLEDQIDLKLDPAPGVGGCAQLRDAPFEFFSRIQRASHGSVLGAGNVTELVALPLDAYGIAVMPIVGLADQIESVAQTDR